ncbi:hypothetical protein LTR39_000638, partial [Cryomyces antarcticus]
MGALLIAVETVSHLIGRCKVYEILYLHDRHSGQALSNLESALLKLWAAMLRFVASAHRLYNKNTGTRTLHALSNPDQVVEHVNSCQDLAKEADTEATC